MIRAIVVDIEGTTTALSFVHDVLFPFARQRLPSFVAERRDDPEVRRQLEAIAAEVGRDLSDDEAVEVLLGWIEEDRKVTPLKALQGMVWAEGYADGRLRGHVYEDAARWLRAWHHAGIRLYVFSSGSVAAQRQLFGQSTCGDLTPLFSGYFDTTTGPKRASGSYRAIAGAIGLPCEEILFLSDVAEELDAARAAGMATTQLVRAGQPRTPGHRHAATFDDVELARV